ncbi:UNVERIFIED_CONTAM: hypothetical protein Scaly_0323400 [Sesamum calycinum]|uniref:Uncharacterized protein n=1 Tax=Sesamum calycinum TaxID=2727403 RepID=A0AAW2SB90_9LAMI
MEVPQKTWNHHEKKKMVIKVGGGAAAVGFGAVVLLGGALATAALASALIVGKKGWSSSKDRRRSRRHQSPPPEMRKQNEQDEANKGQQFVISHEYDHLSNGPTKEVESDNNSGLLVSKRSSSLDEKPRIEINGRKPGDAADASEETLGSISPKKLENNAVSAVVEEGFSTLDARLPFEPKNLMHESELGIHLTKEDFANEIPEESKISEQIHIEEVGPERKARDDVEIEGINHREACVVTQIQPRGEQNCEEIEELTIVDNAVEGVHIDPKEIEVTKVENAVEGNHIDQKEGQNVEEKELEDLCGDSEEISEDVCEEAIQKTEENVGTSTISSLSETMASEIHSEDGEKPLLSVLESPVVEHEHVNRDEVESGMLTKIVGIIQEDDTGEGSRDLVKEQEKCDQPDEGMIQEKREELGLTGEANQSNLQIEVGEPKIPSEKKEENASTDHPLPTPTENRDFGVPVLKEELISPEDVEVTKEDAANEEVAESLEVNENTAPIQSTISQPKYSGDDVESNIRNEVEGELISPENTEAAKEYFANEQVAENVDVNENKTSLQLDVDEPNQHEDDLDRKTVEEAEDSSETINTGITAAKEVNENNTSVQSAFCQPKDSEDDIHRNTEKEVQEELISPENTEATTEDFVNEEVAENLEVDENKTFEQFVIGQPKQHEDDVQGNDAGEVEDSSVITDTSIAATKDDSVMEMNEDGDKEITVKFVVGQPKQHEDVEGTTPEEVADSSVIINTGVAATKDDSVMEMNENDEDNDETSEQFVVGQPKQHEDNVEENTADEVEDSSVIIDKGIATEKEDSFIGMNENDEKGEDNVKDFQDETYSSDEVEESSEETGDSSTESNSDAVWPAESRQEASMEPQQVKLIDQEVEGKIQEDKAGRDGENDFQKIKANGRIPILKPAERKREGAIPIRAVKTFPPWLIVATFLMEKASQKRLLSRSTWQMQAGG